MTDLIARLELATEGSRELDAEIAEEIFPFIAECVPDPEKGVGHWLHPTAGKTYAQDYTTSLDAALTLVPEGHNLDCLTTGDPDTRPSNPAHRCQAIIRPNLGNDGGWQVGGGICREAATPPLALCIAALKARS